MKSPATTILAKPKGFTLVELAIVMTIIGLLIGGVLKGRELLEQARASAIIRDLNGFKAAHIDFMDRYHQRPGDMANATQRLPGCTGDNFCINGNGDGFLGFRNTTQPYINLLWERSNLSDAPPNQETAQYWKHLALDGVITGVNPTAETGAGLMEFGKTHPGAPIVGGYYVASTGACGAGGPPCADPTVWTHGSKGGDFIVMSRRFHGALIGEGAGMDGISPSLLLIIDRKIDDGSLETGAVQGHGTSFAGRQCSGNGAGDQTGQNNDCLMSFRLQ